MATFQPRTILRKAWCLAKAGARRFGGGPRLYLAEALRMAWAETKRIAREIAEGRGRVLAEVERMRAEKVVAPPVRAWQPRGYRPRFTRDGRWAA